MWTIKRFFGSIFALLFLNFWFNQNQSRPSPIHSFLFNNTVIPVEYHHHDSVFQIETIPIFTSSSWPTPVDIAFHADVMAEDD